MVSLLGQCYGLVKNTQSDFANNSNCNWKSGDPNYELAVLPNVGVKFNFKHKSVLHFHGSVEF
jgi:hypothetical protein